MANDKMIRGKIHSFLHDGNQFIIPTIVYYEIRRGLLSKFAPQKTATFNQLCKMSEIGTINKGTGEIAAAIYARLRKTGISLEDDDILIAASCIQNGYTLITNNAKHFEHIADLQILNWTDEK
jgi:predicted nucleic acid-binding protein